MTDESEIVLLETPLGALHQELGGRMVPFAGYSMPVQFPMGIIKEHIHTRDAAGLFDVSHMGQIRVSGPDVVAQLEKLIPVDIAGLEIDQQVYGLLLNERGGIIDDLIICRWSEDEFFLVVNASCKAGDIAHLESSTEGVQLEQLENRALLALQGPEAVTVLADMATEVSELVFMTGRQVELCGIACYVTRSGYTGEDGYEISVPASEAERLAKRLLEYPAVEPIGLGARDTLRLEAGLCLYGNDMNGETSPVEASISWAISRVRRAEGERSGGFPGADNIFAQQRDGVAHRRVGFVVNGKVPVREGASLQDGEGRIVGRVTSGGFGPTLGQPVGMAMLETDLCSPGTSLTADVRGRDVPVEVAKMPLVPQRYYRG